MAELVPINVFKFLPFEPLAVEMCPQGDAPGVFLVVAKGPPLTWAYVGIADDSLRERLRALLTDPGPLREVIEKGATFAVGVVRDPAAREAAAAFLAAELEPAVGRSARPEQGDFECVLRFYGPAEDRPACAPGRGLGRRARDVESDPEPQVSTEASGKEHAA